MEDLKTPNIAVENDDRTISVQVLEFKTSLLEAVEELHIHRDAETRYEQQICKLVLEKQELEWQKESLQSQISRTSSENSESLAAVKKQFQAQIRRIEGEKGKTQLAAELKDKEITSLKEELKPLQLLRYSLEKKLGELEQKLQLQTQTKDSHLNQLGEVERRFSAVSKHCAMVKQAHEKLEQNVEEAMRINKKLTSINETQASTIKALKEDVERLNKQRITSKVSSVCKHREEHLHSVLKDQQLQNLQQRLCVETELNKKLQNEISLEREEKQEVLRSLHHTQRLLQMQTEALSHVEQELNTLLEEHKTLKTEHELNQERTQEKEDRFAQLRDEYQNSKLAWEKEMLLLQKMKEADQVELKTVKEAYNQLQEECKALSLSAVYKARDIHNSQYDLKTQETQNQENSFSTPVGEINLIRVGLHKDESVDCKERLIRPNDIYEPTSHPVKGIPDESNAECQTTRQDGCSHNENRELNVPTHSDQTVPVPSPSEEPDHSVSDLSDEILRHEQASAKVTNQLSDETKTGVGESEPACNAVDKRCPSNIAPSDIDNCLSQLSGPETRSVYEVDGDPLASEPKDRVLEQSLCIPEVTEPQTSDKHIDSQGCATSQYTESKEVKNQTGAPESLYSDSQMENQINAERILEEKTSNPQNTPVFCDITPITDGPNAAQPSPGLKTIQQKPEIPLDSTVSLDTCLLESKDDFSLPALACPLLQVLKAEATQEIGPYDGANIVESKQLPLVADNTEPSTQTTELSVVTEVDSVEAISENANQKDNDSTFASSTQTLKDQRSKDGVSSDEISSHLKITNPQIQNPASPSDGLPKANDQSNVDQKCISVVDASRHGGHKEYWSSFPWGKFIRGKKDPQPRSVDSDVDRSVVSKNSQPSMSLTSSTPSAFEQKSSGFHELVAPFCAPLFTKDKVTKRVMMKTPDKLDTPSKRPHQRAIVEWNAIKQSFSEILPEKENQVLISYSSTLSGSPGSSSVGNGLQQVCTPSVSPPKLQSLEKDGYPTAKRGRSDGKEERKQSDMMAQIAKIEEFMSSEGLMPQKRPKID